jgi:hypothetical protein
MIRPAIGGQGDGVSAAIVAADHHALRWWIFHPTIALVQNPASASLQPGAPMRRGDTGAKRGSGVRSEGFQRGSGAGLARSVRFG